MSKTDVDKRLTTIISTFSVREQKVLLELFGVKPGKGKTYEDVAEMFNISVERVRKLEKQLFELLADKKIEN